MEAGVDMPKIVEYFSKERPVVGGAPQASAAAFGADTGRGLQQLGQSLGESAKVAGQIERRQTELEVKKNERDATSYVVDKLSSLQLESQNRLEELKTEVEEINQYAPAFEEYYNQKTQELINAAPNDLAAQAIQQKAASLSTRLIGKANQYQAKTTVDLQKASSLNAVNNLTNSTLVDPDGFVEYQQQFNEVVNSSKRYMDMVEVEELMREGNNKLYSARVSAEIAANPEFAKQLLTSEEFVENIDSNTFSKLSKKIDSQFLALQEERQKAQIFANIDEALSTGVPIDPRNKDVKKFVNIHYEVSGINEGLAEQNATAADNLAFIAGRTNYLPDSAVSTLRAQLLNGSVEEQIYAIDTISRIQESSPEALDFFPQKDLSKALLSGRLIRSGINPSKALDLATESIDPLNKDIVSQRNIDVNKISAKKDFSIIVEDNFDPGVFTIGADVPDAPIARDSIIADYRTMFEAFYKSVGDDATATELANREFKRTYGASEVTDQKLVMKFPPENYYSVPGLNNKWMTEQLQEDVNNLSNKKVDMKNIVLISDALTAREVGPRDKPSYQVFIKDDLGQYEELRDLDGDLVRYTFDSTKAKEKYRQGIIDKSESSRRRRALEIDSILGTPAQERDEQIMRDRLLF